MAASAGSVLGSTSGVKTVPGSSLMDIDEEVRFVCPNFVSDYIFGVLKLPEEFCVGKGQDLPERLLLHVPPGVVWNGIYRKGRQSIEGVEKMMSFYCIKPYHLIVFDYIGGPSFNLKIFNPYGVEINYNFFKNSDTPTGLEGCILNPSEIEVDKLGGTLSYNVYHSGRSICEVVLGNKHIRKTEVYKVLKRSDWESLGIVESMESVRLSFRNITWLVKLVWRNGKLYFDRGWYKFAKAGKFGIGDAVVFHKTDWPQKFIATVFENEVLSKCNVSGVGQRDGVMEWFKMASPTFICTGEMEIPRVFTNLSQFKLDETVKLILRDGETISVKFCSESNFLFGMRNLVRLYSIESTDVMVFTLVRQSTFVLSIFKFYGMESEYNAVEVCKTEAMKKVCLEDIIILSDSDNSEEGMAVEQEQDAEEEGEGIGEEADEMPEANVSFRVTLKPSHVDKRQHGVYFPSSLYSTYKRWTNMTNIRLICGAKVCFVSVLRTGKVCRFGRGWSEFTTANELSEGDILQLNYIDHLTFQVEIV
ncbi:hypothetical protein DCAR_0206314 [Daucus carota subsp. sativus]|uniref:Uncharacterized protein n=1 Tax=Daucus carota subsp. sativus TaxID=79200 RepID=A0A161Y607_DAUCS|nr:hypothetical protein DCAR_0206314 [Daucus carota subsp. sativus]